MPLKYTNIQTLLLLLFVFLVTYSLSKYAEKHPHRAGFPLLLAIMILAFLCGLRSTDVGRDTVAYYRDIQLMELGYSNALDYYDIGYRVFVWLVLLFTNSPQCVLFIISFLTITFIVLRLWDLRKSISFSKAMLFFFCISYCSVFSGIRQWLAVALVFFASRYIAKEKYMLYFIFVSIATSFHLPAILSISTLVVYLLFARIVKKRGMRTFLLFLSFITFVVSCVYMDYVTTNTRYSIDYFRQEADLGFMIIARIVLFVLFYLNYRSSCRFAQNREFLSSQKDGNTFIHNYFLYTIGCVLGGLFGSTIGRISWYFMPYEWTMFSTYLPREKHWTCFIIKLIVYIITAYSFYVFVVRGIEYLTPYSFFWQ